MKRFAKLFHVSFQNSDVKEVHRKLCYFENLNAQPFFKFLMENCFAKWDYGKFLNLKILVQTLIEKALQLFSMGMHRECTETILGELSPEVGVL